MGRTDQGSGVGHGVAEWRAAGRALRERAEMTLALGRCLEQLPAGPGLTPEGLAERLQAVIGEVLAQGGSQKEAPAASALACGHGVVGAARSVAAKEERDPGAALRALRGDLYGHRWPYSTRSVRRLCPLFMRRGAGGRAGMEDSVKTNALASVLRGGMILWDTGRWAAPTGS